MFDQVRACKNLGKIVNIFAKIFRSEKNLCNLPILKFSQKIVKRFVSTLPFSAEGIQKDCADGRGCSEKIEMMAGGVQKRL